MHTEGRPRKDTERRRPSTSQGERPQKTLAPPTLSSWTISFQVVRSKFPLFKLPSVWYLLQQPEQTNARVLGKNEMDLDTQTRKGILHLFWRSGRCRTNPQTPSVGLGQEKDQEGPTL